MTLIRVFELAEYNGFDAMPNWIDPFVGTPEERILPDEVRTPTPGSDRSNDEQPPPVAGDLREERQAILAQVRDCDGNLTQAARRLGIARSTLYLRLAKYGRRPALTN